MAIRRTLDGVDRVERREAQARARNLAPASIRALGGTTIKTKAGRSWRPASSTIGSAFLRDLLQLLDRASGADRNLLVGLLRLSGLR